MREPKLYARRRAHFELSSRLAHLDDRRLRSALKAGRVHNGPWGASYPAEIDGSKVFIKRIPLTELEASRPWSTRNHFRLPTYYNYGVGSAGFGVFRELVGHITTTNWVLEGASPSYPLLLHHRVTERTETHGPAEDRTQDYVKRWNGSRAVGNFMRARVDAKQEVWLVLEHLPYRMSEWMMANQDRVEEVIDELFAAISRLGHNGMVHFDAHFGNVLTDGETVYVSDFGLLNDANFDLTKPERDFLARHRHYDYAEALFAVGLAPLWALWARPADSQAEALAMYDWLGRADTQQKFAIALLENIDRVSVGPLAISPSYAETLRRYHDVVLYMAGFLDTMRRNPKKNTPYDDEHVRRLLVKAGAPVG